LIVAIDGLDGSGKSRLATRLAQVLTERGQTANILHVDDFRRPLDFTGLDAEAEAALYYDQYYDFAALQAALDERARDAAGVTILEGVMLLRARPPAEACLAVLEISAGEARRRIQERDQAKGRTAEEVARRIDRRYFPAQARYRQAHDPLGRADLVIDNEDWRRPRLVRHGERVPPWLSQALAVALEAA
jgi:uridine kinase